MGIPLACLESDRYGAHDLRRDGRAVEGARLESVYTVMNRIEGSNPSPSASIHEEIALSFALTSKISKISQGLAAK